MAFLERLRNFHANYREYGLPLLVQGVAFCGLVYFADEVVNRDKETHSLERPAEQMSPLDYFEEGARLSVRLQYNLDQNKLSSKQTESPLETIVEEPPQD